MIKEFLRQNFHLFFLTGASLTIFAIVFKLFQFGWEIYWVATGLILFIHLVYLVSRAINFRVEHNRLEEIDQLQQKLKIEKEDKRLLQQDVEEYFLLWVHQIKTPITASYLLLEEDNSENKPLLQQELLKVENYVNMALNYLKVLNPARDMNFSYVSINELIKPLLKKYRLQFIYSNITLHYQDNQHVILTEPNLMSLVIEQILSNALKYTRDGDIWISFNSDTKELVIKDNGLGIRPEDLPKIFNKGYAGMNGQLNTKSSGIGLYLVQLISKRLEQSVSVESAYKEGSTFTIHF